VHFFARPEHWDRLLSYADFDTIFWISTNTTSSILHDKRPKASQFDAIPHRHGSNNLIKHDVYCSLYNSDAEVKETICNNACQF
jgi:hypothetical protein